VHVRNIVKLGVGASLRVVEHHVGAGNGVPLLNAVAQIMLADDARLTHVRVQEQSDSATVIARTQATLAARATYELTLLDLGAQLARHDLQIALDGIGASTTVAGAAVVNGRQHADLQLRIEHRARDTTSRVAFRGIADQRGRSVLGGAIVVQPGADGSDAALSNRNLLLSPHAEIDAKPELEIYADEVKAAHGATVGQLDETALFYLRSRGLPLAQARAMLTFAFVREMLEGVGAAELREHLAGRVISRLPTTREDETR
jgi:Fe-S cluster assembly protein SufD